AEQAMLAKDKVMAKASREACRFKPRACAVWKQGMADSGEQARHRDARLGGMLGIVILPRR
ncbi:MAG: hypothetical protein ABIP44_13025, partial [Pseudoxanthomonas sp.]